MKTPGIQRSTLGDDHAFCVYCLSDINISHSGQFDIETHCKSMKHKKYVSAKDRDREALKVGFISTIFSHSYSY